VRVVAPMLHRISRRAAGGASSPQTVPRRSAWNSRANPPAATTTSLSLSGGLTQDSETGPRSGAGF
jgi:hypothetical protein